MRVGGDEIDIHVSSDESAGALLVAEVRIPAGGGPPGLHRHAADEVYRVEAGELAIYVGDERRRRVTRGGEVVHIPGGVAHTVRNESAAPARALVVFSPGSEMEAFVRAAAGAAAPEDVVALAERHGITFA